MHPKTSILGGPLKRFSNNLYDFYYDFNEPAKCQGENKAGIVTCLQIEFTYNPTMTNENSLNHTRLRQFKSIYQ